MWRAVWGPGTAERAAATALETLRTGVEGLRRYGLRSVLGLVGIVMGIASVLTMLSIAEGARAESLRQMELLGVRNFVLANRPLTITQRGAGRPYGLRIEDPDRLARLVPSLALAAPLTERVVPLVGPRTTLIAPVLAVTPAFQQIVGLSAADGRLLAATDLESGVRCCVLGATVARTLFGSHSPVSNLLRVNGEWFKVAGVLAERASAAVGGAAASRDLNAAALVPISTVAGRAPQFQPHRPIDEVWLQSGDASPDETVRLVAAAVLALHRGVDDVQVLVPRELVQQRLRLQRTFNIVVGGIAAVSLLVGGLGIMNVLLAAVIERTPEIGIRRAVGATRSAIGLQFVTESLLLGLAGGLLGLLAGVAAAMVVAAYAGWPTRLSPGGLLVSLLVSLAVGLASGFYPARRAARLAPIEALRYE